MAEILSEMGISPDKTPQRRTKYHNQSCSTSSSDALSGITDMSSTSTSDNGGDTAEEISIRIAAQKMIEEKEREASNNGNWVLLSFLTDYLRLPFSRSQRGDLREKTAG